MKGTGRKGILLIIAGVALALVALWVLGNERVSREARLNFEWFSTLGFPDVKGCRYIRAASGSYSTMGDEQPTIVYSDVFLLTNNGQSFTVLTPDLRVLTYSNDSTRARTRTTPGFEELDLKKQAQARISEIQKPLTEAAFFDRRNFGQRVSGPMQDFSLAWACWRQGLQREAGELYEAAKKPRGQPAMPWKKQTAWEALKARFERAYELVRQSLSRDRSKPDPTFRDTLVKELSTAAMWQAVLDCGDPEVTRPKLLASFDEILARYPKSEHHDKAKKMSDTLKRMITEDNSHPKVTADGLEKMPDEQESRELVFQLRNQNGHQWSQPGSCDVFHTWGKNQDTNSPAHQLLALGYAAVPALIAELDSETLSRSVGYHRNFYFSHTVLTTGDCVQQILTRITGRSFYTAKTTSSYMSRDGQVSDTRKAAEEWWADFQRKGEERMLVEGVAEGGSDAGMQAERLGEKYPGAVTEALRRGIAAASDHWTRRSLVELLGKYGDQSSVPILKNDMENGLDLSIRVTAANGLSKKGQKALALEQMIKEWENIGPPNTQAMDATGELVRFLACSDSVAAIASLENRFRAHPVSLRLDIIEAIGETNAWFFGETITNGSSPATLVAIETCLVAALDDTEKRTGMGGSRNGKEFSDPRICDMAAYFLSKRWPDRYSFDLSASSRTRERQRIECINVWRKAHDQALLPVPQPPTVRVATNEAAFVTIVEWAASGMQPAAGISNRVANLKGKSLRGGDIAALLADFVAHPETGAGGLEIETVKEDDLTGVRLVLKLVPMEPGLLSPSVVNSSQRVVVGKKSSWGSSGTGSFESYNIRERWQNLETAIDKAIAAAPETPFEVSVQIEIR